MRLWMNEPGLRESWPGALQAGAAIARWSSDSGSLPLEECVRKGIEALAGFLISVDAFDISGSPDEMFCACVEMYHAATATEGEAGDYIGVYFRVVEFKDATYPMVGQRYFKMLMQPLSDGNAIARWNAVDGGEAGESSRRSQTMVDDVNTLSSVCRPLALGAIPEQEEGDASLPSFLILRDPGAGWQIWRRFSPTTGDGKPIVTDGFREETYVMVFPMLNADVNWRFRVYDLPGGGARVEMKQGSSG